MNTITPIATTATTAITIPATTEGNQMSPGTSVVVVVAAVVVATTVVTGSPPTE